MTEAGMDAGATQPGTGVGEALQRAREARGLALAEVAQQLKFAARQLEALEQERFDVLPGGTFARGMVRSYAKLLKLDPEPLLQRIADRFDAPDANHLAARYSQPVPFSDSARRSTFVYLGLSLGVLALGGGVAYQWYHDSRARKPAAAPVASAKHAPAEKPRPTGTVKPAAASVAKAPPKAAEVAKVDSPKVETAKADNAAKIAPGVHRIVLRCDEEAWIEVRDATDRLLVSSLNPAGSERVVQGRGPFTLVIGNALHVRVTHNERPVDLQPYTRVEVARFTLP